MKIRWAAGIERLIGIVEEETYPKSGFPIAIVAVRSKQDIPLSLFVQKLAHQLRGMDIPTATVFEGNTSKQIKKLSKETIGAIFIGEDEMKSGNLTFKNLLNGSQLSIPLDIPTLASYCKNFLKDNKNAVIHSNSNIHSSSSVVPASK